MGMLLNVNDYVEVRKCIYKVEHYSVRDNGAVLRHSQINKRKRSADNQWTFGKLNSKTRYFEIGSVRVHRVVATAFHGEQPSKEHIVDHIDTNRQNNRPENLRWITRLENVLLNPITAKRIALVCGSVEDFLANPSKFRDKFPEPNLSWMCSVSIEDAQTSKNRLMEWAKSDKIPIDHPLNAWIYKHKDSQNKEDNLQSNSMKHDSSTLDEEVETIFTRVEKETGLSRLEFSSKSKKEKYNKARIYAAKLFRLEIGLSDEVIGRLIGRSTSMVNAYLQSLKIEFRNKEMGDEIFQQNNLCDSKQIVTDSLTPNAIQNNWKTPAEFPCCPKDISNNPIVDYFSNLKQGNIFSQNQYSKSIIDIFALSTDKNTLWIICKNDDADAIKPYLLAEVLFENGLFIHRNLGSFFDRVGAERLFVIKQGLDWCGGQTFDEFC